MMRWIKPATPRLMSNLSSDWVANWWMRVFSRGLAHQIQVEATDRLLELLLVGMDLAFFVSRSYRSHIEDFEARYVFRTREGQVDVTADFADGNMRVHEVVKEPWTVCVSFSDPAALRAFLFSKNQDVLQSLLKNEVAVEGNLNYLYKFGFMAKDLMRRLGLAGV